MENYYDMNGFRVHFRIADYASDPMVMAITATAEDDEFDAVLTVNIGSRIEVPFKASASLPVRSRKASGRQREI